MSIELGTEAIDRSAQLSGDTTDDTCCATAEGQVCPERPVSFIQFLPAVAEMLQQEIDREIDTGAEVSSIQLDLIRNLIMEIKQGGMPDLRCGYRFLDLVSRDICDPIMVAAKDLWDVYELVCNHFPPELKDSESVESATKHPCNGGEPTSSPSRPSSFLEFLSEMEDSLLGIKDDARVFDHLRSSQLKLVQKLIPEIRQGTTAEPRSRDEFTNQLSKDMSHSISLGAKDLWDLYEHVMSVRD